MYGRLTNPAPLVMSCSEYMQKRPSATWVRLTNSHLNLLESIINTFGKHGEVTGLVIPVRTSEQEVKTPVTILLATSNAGIIDFTNKISDIRDRAEVDRYVNANRDRISVTADIQGTVRYGSQLSAKKRKRLEVVGVKYTPDFVIIDDGKKPGMAAGIIVLSIGALLCCLGVIWLVRRLYLNADQCRNAMTSGGR